MKLRDWLKERGMLPSEFARRVGVSRCTVHLWLSGKAHPTYKNYIKIKEITDGRVKYEEVYKT